MGTKEDTRKQDVPEETPPASAPYDGEQEEQDREEQSAEEFRDDQKRQAAEQNLKSPNAVPEQRPIAADTGDPEENVVAQRLRESGDDQAEPMPKEAYDKAASDDQAQAAEKEQIGHESVRPGAVIRVTEGEYEGAYAVVNEIKYTDHDETAKAASGNPEAARFAKVASVLARTRGGRHANLSLTPDQFERVDQISLERGIA